jgi:hypothetical protein
MVMALMWTNNLNMRVGAYINNKGDARQLVLDRSSDIGPSFQMVQELNTVLEGGFQKTESINAKSLESLESLEASWHALSVWLGCLKEHWWKHEFHKDWLMDIGYTTNTTNQNNTTLLRTHIFDNQTSGLEIPLLDL